jgi:hypothetical protein
MALALLTVNGFRDHTVADRISWDVLASGGTMESSSSGYRMSASVGQIAVDLLVGSTHQVHSGFWNAWLFEAVGGQRYCSLGLPTTYQLSQNFPNPCGSKTTIPYALPTPSRVSVEIYDLRGQRVRQIVHEAKEAGYYAVTWDGRNDAGRRAGSGTYICRMIARPSDGREFIKSRKMVLVN